MNRTIRLAGVIACAVSLSACATITRGTRQNWTVETDPVGAQVALSTGQTCVSPCTLRLKRKTEFTVRATLDGYEPAEASINSVVRGGGVAAVAGNVLVGGIIGGVVDATNGSMNDLVPNPLRITMTPIGGTPAPTTAEGNTVADPANAPADPAPAPAPQPQ